MIFIISSCSSDFRISGFQGNQNRLQLAARCSLIGKEGLGKGQVLRSSHETSVKRTTPADGDNDGSLLSLTRTHNSPVILFLFPCFFLTSPSSPCLEWNESFLLIITIACSLTMLQLFSLLPAGLASVSTSFPQPAAEIK